MSYQEKRTGLREFQENLSRRIADASESPQQMPLLGFSAGEEDWLIELADAGEILPVPQIYSVPLSAPWFRGLANVRGTLFGVTDLAALHGFPPVVPSGEARLLLIGARTGANCAVMVSRIIGMRNNQDFAPDGTFQDNHRTWVQGAHRDSTGKRWLILSVQDLLKSPTFLNAGAEFSILHSAA